MIEIILNDMQKVMFAYAIFGCMWTANTVLSIYYNVASLKERLEIRRLLEGVIKALSVMFGTLLLVVGIDLLIHAANLNGTKIGDLVTVASILLTIGIASVMYAKQAYEKLQSILQTDR